MIVENGSITYRILLVDVEVSDESLLINRRRGST